MRQPCASIMREESSHIKQITLDKHAYVALSGKNISCVSTHPPPPPPIISSRNEILFYNIEDDTHRQVDVVLCDSWLDVTCGTYASTESKISLNCKLHK